MYHYTTNGCLASQLLWHFPSIAKEMRLKVQEMQRTLRSCGRAKLGLKKHRFPMWFPCDSHGIAMQLPCISHVNKPCNILDARKRSPSPCNRRRRGNSDGEALQCLFSPPNHAQNLPTFSFSNCQHRGSLDREFKVFDIVSWLWTEGNRHVDPFRITIPGKCS